MDEHVELAAGTYRVGEPGAEREVALPAVRIGRFPVVNEQVARFVAETRRPVAPALARKLADPQLADHPATDLTFEEADACCAWAGGRLPTGDEWEAAARGPDGRAWPWARSSKPSAARAWSRAGGGPRP